MFLKHIYKRPTDRQAVSYSFPGLVMGGSDSTGKMMDTVEVFTPGQTCTKALAPMPLAATDPVVAFVAGKI